MGTGLLEGPFTKAPSPPRPHIPSLFLDAHFLRESLVSRLANLFCELWDTWSRRVTRADLTIDCTHVALNKL